MKRVLVVGAGPVRLGAGPGASVVAAELAAGLEAAGIFVVALDASPTSALLWDDAPKRRYVERIDTTIVRRVAEVETVDAVTASASGRVALRALAETGEGMTVPRWLGGSPRELLGGEGGEGADAMDASASSPSSAGPIVDVVAASDGGSIAILGAFASAPVAIPDAEHRWLQAGAYPAKLEESIAARLRGRRGLATLRFAGDTLVLADFAETALWSVAASLRGMRAGEILARLLLDEPVSAALRGALVAPRATSLVRTPSFDFDPFPDVDRTIGARPKSFGATIAMDPAPTVPAPSGKRRVLLVGPSAVRADHGAEASAAIRLASRAAAGLGHEVIVVTEREGTGAEAWASRVHVTNDVASVLAREAPSDVLIGFGSDPELATSLAKHATDVTEGATSYLRSLEVAPAERNAIEVHVLLVSDGERARILGTFEHVERTAVHPEDAAAVFPALAVGEATLRAAEAESVRVAAGAKARGLLTVRWAAGSSLALLGASPGITTHALSLGLVLDSDLVAEAVRAALDGVVDESPALLPRHVAVEEHVFPFAALGAQDTRLDRRRRSTGSVLAIADTVPRAYARALAAMGVSLKRPRSDGERAILLAGGEPDALALADVGRRLFALGFDVVATAEAAAWLQRARVPHGLAADATERVASRRVVAVVATSDDCEANVGARADLRRAALVAGIPCFSTVHLIRVAVSALEQNAQDESGPEGGRGRGGDNVDVASIETRAAR